MRATLIVFAPAATNPRSLRLLQHLAASGIKCQVITTPPIGYDDGSPLLDGAGDEYGASTVLFPPWRGGLARQAFERLRFVLASATFARDFASDIVIAGDIEGLLGCALRATGASRLVYDIHDSTSVRFYRLPGMFTRVLSWIEGVLVRQAAAVMIVDERRKSELGRAIASHPLLVAVENYPDDCNATIRAAPRIARSNALQVCLCGYLTRQRGLDLARSVVRMSSDVQLVLFGKLGHGITEAEILASPRTTYLGVLPHPAALAQMKAADVVLALYDPEFPGHKFCAPGKLYEAFMLGRPVLVNGGVGLDEIVRHSGAGFIIDYNDPQTMSRALTIASLERNGELRAMGVRARQAFETKYNARTFSERLSLALGV